MDKKKLKKQIYASNFKVNNGKVLRTINILRTSYNKLDGVASAVAGLGVSEWEYMDCLNYLSQAGYIHLRTIGEHCEVIFADVNDYSLLEANVTALGIRLLHGSIDDPVIEV